VRATTPKAEIGISTGAWIVPDASVRKELVAEWSELPDFASVNFSEPGAAELARLLLRKGIGVEAGLSDVHSAEDFITSNLAARCIRVLLEPQEQSIDDADQTVRVIESLLDRAGVNAPRLLHGTEATAWHEIGAAIKRGYDIRIGFEDTLRLPDGTLARSNAELVAQAVQRIKRVSTMGPLLAKERVSSNLWLSKPRCCNPSPQICGFPGKENPCAIH
jgi:uncharacterized protein (DUF849 family)